MQAKKAPGKSRALDCGAGIGRVTKEVLTRYFSKVDLVEQNEAFLKQARQNLTADSKVGRLFHSGLQNFEPSEKYDLFWCQWVLGHLTDDDLVSFLRRCRKALNENGMIIIKENISSHGIVEDSLDSSVTRPIDEFLRIFQLANLRVVRQAAQNNFPKQLFSVKLFALRPVSQPSPKNMTAADNTNSAKGLETSAANESESATNSSAVESKSTEEKPNKDPSYSFPSN